MPFPTREQSLVIMHRGGPLVVVAGPGTGKTRTLVERMIQLLREDQSREVTFVTFTRTSRRDTEKKLRQAFGDAIVESPDLIFPRTSTLHTYAKRLVHRFAHLIGRESTFSILIDGKGEKDLIIEEIASDLGLVVDQVELSDAIAKYRATNEWPTHFPVEEAHRPTIIQRMEQLLRLYRTYDMQGVVLAACQVLASSQGALPTLFLQVDEYQDLNPVDQQFLALLTSHPTSEVVIVGDDAQSIYGFRDANYQGVRGLWDSETWENTRFPDSFRLPAHVLNAALDLIRDRGYLGAEINRKPANDAPITVLQCTTTQLQIEAVARDIQERMSAGRDDDQPNLSLNDFLVLCPTRTQGEQAVASLNERFDLPAHMPTRSSIPDDYWSVVLLLRIAHDSDPLALRQWLPVLGLSIEEIRSLRDEALQADQSLARHCFSAPDERIQRFQSLIAQVATMVHSPDSLVDTLAQIEGVQTPPGFTSLLESTSDDEGRLPRIGRILQAIYEHFGVLDPEDLVPEDEKVLVATMHSAKGLEAEFVYCTWMNSTFMPMAGRDPEEERRVLYVALTRAKQDVLITYPEEFDQARKRRLGQEIISPFLAEIGSHLRIIRASAPVIRSDPLPWRL